MMNNYFAAILFFSSLVTSGCNREVQTGKETRSQEKRTRIEGTFQGGEGCDVLLEEMAVSAYIPIDTVTCDDQGQFQISFEPGHTAFYVLRTDQPGYITLLIEPDQQITINGNYGQPGLYSVKGSKGSEQLMELSAEHKRTLNELSNITGKILESRDSPGYPEKKIRLDQKFDSITTSFRSYSLEFINRNRESLSILIALYNLYGEGLPVFHPAEDLKTYQFVDSLLQARYPDIDAVQSLHAQLLETRSTKQKMGVDHRPGIGEIAPDFVSSRPDGSEMALFDLKGNYILLSFWAGWSNLSRKENQYLKEIWNTRGDFPLKIVQVSFDGERETWTRAIKQDGLTWDHVSDLRRWESVIADLYGVEKIPSNYLINPEGKIVAQDLFGKALVEKFKNLYRNK